MRENQSTSFIWVNFRGRLDFNMLRSGIQSTHKSYMKGEDEQWQIMAMVAKNKNSWGVNRMFYYIPMIFNTDNNI